jgi:hypothetical protein
MIEQHYALSYIISLFDTQASTSFGIHVPYLGSFLCPRELLERRNAYVSHVLWMLVACVHWLLWYMTNNINISSFKYSGLASYDRLDVRPTWVTTKIFVLTYEQISNYDPHQRQRGEHISGITCSSLWALAVFACFAGANMLIPLIKVCTV